MNLRLKRLVYALLTVFVAGVLLTSCNNSQQAQLKDTNGDKTTSSTESKSVDKTASKDEAEPLSKEAQAHYDEAKQYYKTGKFPKAIESFEQVLAIEPENKNTLKLLVVLYPFVGKMNESLETHKKLEKIDPDNPVIYINVSQTYLAMQDKARALESLKKAKELAKKNRPDLVEKIDNGISQLK